MAPTVTSIDVAKAAGVSQATVSRVLNDDSRVRAETRSRVLEAIDRLGYRPNAIARGLVTSTSSLVGVVVSDVTNPFYPELLEAISEQLAAHRLKMVLYNGAGQQEAQLVELLLDQRVDGIILTTALVDSKLVARLVARRFPLVLVNRSVNVVACDTICSENGAGAAAAATHLLELGHRRIAVIAGAAKASTSRDRVAGFRAALRCAGVKLPAELVVRGNFSFEVAYAATRRLLGLRHPPTAIFCANDLMAFGALAAARRERIAVPARLSVVGYDAVAMSQWEPFALTTVRQAVPEMACKAVDVLLKRIADPARPPEQIVLPSSLVVGRTTAPEYSSSSSSSATNSMPGDD